MSSKGVQRMILSDQADEEICKIDLITEKLLASPEYLNDEEKSARLNAQRECLIAEIRETLRLNMVHLDKDPLATTQAPEMHMLFKHFCYTIMHKGQVRLVSTDTYMSPKQVTLVQTLVDSIVRKEIFEWPKEREQYHSVLTSREVLLNIFDQVQINYVSMKTSSISFNLILN
jgi:hypothetical protein